MIQWNLKTAAPHVLHVGTAVFSLWLRFYSVPVHSGWGLIILRRDYPEIQFFTTTATPVAVKVHYLSIIP